MKKFRSSLRARAGGRRWCGRVHLAGMPHGPRYAPIVATACSPQSDAGAEPPRVPRPDVNADDARDSIGLKQAMPAIDTRPEPRPRTLTIGVWPIRPQVLALGGVIDGPASSSKTIQASRSAQWSYPRPGLPLPHLDGTVIPLDGASGRLLPAPAMPLHNPPRALIRLGCPGRVDVGRRGPGEVVLLHLADLAAADQVVFAALRELRSEFDRVLVDPEFLAELAERGLGVVLPLLTGTAGSRPEPAVFVVAQQQDAVLGVEDDGAGGFPQRRGGRHALSVAALRPCPTW